MAKQGGGPPPTHLQRAQHQLAMALEWSTKHGRTERAERIRHAQRTLLGNPNPVPAMGASAIIRARAQAQHGPTRQAGMCLSMVVDAYQVNHGVADAIRSWHMAVHKHRTSNPTAIPRGWPIYWAGGSEGHGHIAISAGDGWCWSTDILAAGRFGLVRVDRIRTQWGLDLLGWTGDLNGSPIV